MRALVPDVPKGSDRLAVCTDTLEHFAEIKICAAIPKRNTLLFVLRLRETCGTFITHAQRPRRGAWLGRVAFLGAASSTLWDKQVSGAFPLLQAPPQASVQQELALLVPSLLPGSGCGPRHGTKTLPASTAARQHSQPVPSRWHGSRASDSKPTCHSPSPSFHPREGENKQKRGGWGGIKEIKDPNKPL